MKNSQKISLPHLTHHHKLSEVKKFSSPVRKCTEKNNKEGVAHLESHHQEGCSSPHSKNRKKEPHLEQSDYPKSALKISQPRGSVLPRFSFNLFAFFHLPTTSRQCAKTAAATLKDGDAICILVTANSTSPLTVQQ